ncbi:MAG: hypothetical protein Q4E74_08350 [Ruminococcus sp.]|nr:hypothetical protein [Ruminococcus sp.]
MPAKKKNILIFTILICLAVLAGVFFPAVKSAYYKHKMNGLDEYKSYSAGNLTVSLRDVSEAGLNGSTRLDVYIVDNDNNSVKYAGQGRLDYYDDFTPYTEFIENDGGFAVRFVNKNSDYEVELEI